MAIGYLLLENGTIFEGEYIGADGAVTGEIVFTTAMTGYLETLTDKSYYGQIVIQTFPLIGNYGVISSDYEGEKISVRGYIVKHPCEDPSNFRSEGKLAKLLREQNIVCLSGIDTRALTKIIRESGVMNGKIMTTKPTEKDMEEIKKYTIADSVPTVSVKETVKYEVQDKKLSVALLDFGYKENIKNELLKRGCEVHLMPQNTTLAEIKALNVDGVMLSNGPGDPADNVEIIENLKEIMASGMEMFGICLGHQLLALASGFKTSKLKYGHRGANQPVKDLVSGRVYISTQNHGYAVENDSVDPSKADVWFVNVNDNTCEGIMYKNVNAFSVQFHPEACAGPLDTTFLFDKFISNMEENKNAIR